MGQIPPKVCRQKPDRHDHKGSDKYRGKSADTTVQPDAADTAYQRGTGVNMLYENIRFLSRHHITHQTAAYPGKHSYKHQQEGIIRISIINSRHHTQGCKDSQAYRIHDQHSLVIKSSQSATQKIMFDIQQYKNRQ